MCLFVLRERSAKATPRHTGPKYGTVERSPRELYFFSQFSVAFAEDQTRHLGGEKSVIRSRLLELSKYWSNIYAILRETLTCKCLSSFLLRRNRDPPSTTTTTGICMASRLVRPNCKLCWLCWAQPAFCCCVVLLLLVLRNK